METKQAEAALQLKIAMERTLVRFSARFAGATRFDEALQAGLADLSRLSGASRAYLFLIRPDGKTMDNSHEWCAPSVEPHIHDLQGLPLSDFPWWMDRLREGQPIHVRDVSRLPPEASAEKGILEAQDIKSILVVPVHVGGRLAGFMGFDNVLRAEAWADDDLRLLEVAAGIVGSVLQRREAERALRLSERRFRLLVEQSPLSVQITDGEGQTLQVNRAWERLWGLEIRDLEGYNVRHDAQLRDAGVLPLLEHAYAGEPVAMPAVPYTPRKGPLSGRQVWIRAVAYPVKNEDGQVREVVLIHEDVTEQKQAETELAASRQQLALSEKLSALGALVSGVAHEVRTPLTYIANHLALLDLATLRPDVPEALRPRLREHVASAQSGVDRVNTLVEDLRGYARLRVGRRVRSDLSSVIRRALDLFEATHRGSITVEHDLAHTGEVEVDPEQMQQVALNLLTNATEAMDGRGRVRLVTRHAEGHAELLVEDEGPGIAPDAEPHIFEPFYTTKPEGTGLGLSISKRLVEAHGGTIRHEPRPDGARFVVRIPHAP